MHAGTLANIKHRFNHKKVTKQNGKHILQQLKFLRHQSMLTTSTLHGIW